MIEVINKNWSWIEATAVEIVLTNEFGNIIFLSEAGHYWRICPEELRCTKVADDQQSYDLLLKDAGFKEDWEMANLVDVARIRLGELEAGEKYCLKLPAVLGGLYQHENIGKVSQIEQLTFAGGIGQQIKDLPNGQKIELNLED